MYIVCQEYVGKLSGGCDQVVWIVWVYSLEGVVRLSGKCG